MVNDDLSSSWSPWVYKQKTNGKKSQKNDYGGGPGKKKRRINRHHITLAPSQSIKWGGGKKEREFPYLVGDL